MNNNEEFHNATAKFNCDKVALFFTKENPITEGRIIVRLDLGNIAEYEIFQREFPVAVGKAQGNAAEEFGLPQDPFISKFVWNWINAYNREGVIEYKEKLGFEHDDPIFLTYDIRLEKTTGPAAIDIDVSLTSTDPRFVLTLPAVLSFVRVKLLVQKELNG